MQRYIVLMLLIPLAFCSCETIDEAPRVLCPDDPELINPPAREFGMGFSTWEYGPDKAEAVYDFIEDFTDIYSEQVDNYIPWSAWITGSSLPVAFVNDIATRVSRKPADHKLMLSVSLLNTERNDLLEDYDGSIPNYSALNNQIIEDGYYRHLSYLVDQLGPDYLVMAMEANDLLIHSAEKWEQYKLLIDNIRSRLKQKYPDLPIAESVTLHNWFEPNIVASEDYISEVDQYVKKQDFTAISFYPFLRDWHTQEKFQNAFDFLHSHTDKPIAFVETAHLGEELLVPELALAINGDECEQKVYVETLLSNAYNSNYTYVIWWSFRDYDLLAEEFPEAFDGAGLIWRDTGLLDGVGKARAAFHVWREIFEN